MTKKINQYSLRPTEIKGGIVMSIESGESIYGGYYCKDTDTGIHGYGNTPENARLDLQNKLADYRSNKR
jgi:hypothetical protein